MALRLWIFTDLAVAVAACITHPLDLAKMFVLHAVLYVSEKLSSIIVVCTPWTRFPQSDVRRLLR
jgi:hypothetical protein